MSKVLLVIQVFFLLLFLRLLLSVRDFSETLDWMKKCNTSFYFSDNLIRNKKVIEFSSKLVPNCTCLIQAIAFKVIRSSDPEIMLVIGISKTDQFESHAWICKNDNIILGGADSATKFTKLVAF